MLATMRAVTFVISLLCMLARCPAAPDAAPTPQRLVAKLETEAALASKGLSTGAAAQDVTSVYFNGLAPGWLSASFGCMDCNFEDTERKYSASLASAYTSFVPWGALILQTAQPFSSAAVLDIYVKGAGISKTAFLLEDTVARRYSMQLAFGNPAVLRSSNTTLNVLGSDADGWIRMQINLQSLTYDMPNTTWDRLVFKDLSGTGFSLQFAFTKILGFSSTFSAAGFEWAGMSIPGTPSFPPLASFPSVAGPRPSTPVPGAAPTPVLPVTLPTSTLPTSPGTAPITGGTGAPTSGTAPFPSLNLLPVLNNDTLMAGINPTRFIMRFKSTTAVTQIRSICDELASIKLPAGFTAPRFTGGCDSASFANTTVPGTSATAWPFQSFQVNSIADLESMRRSLADSVMYFERDLAARTTQIFASTLDATYNVRYWNLDRLDQTNLPLDGVYNPGALDGSGSHIFVVDTGIRWSHQDFANRVGTGASFIGSSNWDDNGHGTHVAGIAAGAIHGVAKNAIVHAVKVLDAQGSGSYSNIISGLGWVKNYVRQNGIRQAVAVMSLGGPRASSLNDAVEDLAASGIPVVAAAGNNNGGDSCSFSPASAPSAIAVGASDNNDRLASFSNVGGCVFTFAPGVSVQSASYGSDSGETTMSGTSMAGPHVAGVIAMILQDQPGTSVSNVKSAISRAAASISFSSSSPARFLNAQTARLRSGQSTPTPASAPVATPAPVASPTPVAAPITLTPGFQPISFPSFGAPFSKPSWCATCSWCMFCN